MVIKLAILDNDIDYTKRLTAALHTRFSDKIEVYSFTDCGKAIEAVKALYINVLLSSGSFMVNCADIPRNCGFAYLVDSPDIKRMNEQKAICRYQKTEVIFNEIVGIYADSNVDSSIVRGGKPENPGMPVYLITSASGGVGATTVAAAAAKHLARDGCEPLYISLELFGNPELFFVGAGSSCLSDAIFSVKGKKANLPLKLASAAKRDESGVYYYSPAANAMDVQELTGEDVGGLFSALGQSGFCGCVVADASFSFDERYFELLRLAKRSVIISDGTEAANDKLERAVRAYRIAEASEGMVILAKTALFYNKFNNKSGRQAESSDLRVLGGAPKYELQAAGQPVQRLIDDKIIALVADYLTGGEK